MERLKFVSNPEGTYHRVFDRKTGFTARWGRTKQDDPDTCFHGAEIADIEVSTICFGPGNTLETRQPCSFCYKSNSEVGENMSLDTFKKVLDKLGDIDQCALGIGSVESNPDLWRIMEECRSRGVIPNLTVNGFGIEGETADNIARLCGACAVSDYGDSSYSAVDALVKAGLKQVNIHKLLAKSTLQRCHSLLEKVAAAKAGTGDPRLKGLNAVVFLLLKPKGKRNQLQSIDSLDDYKQLLDHALSLNVQVGFDSCSAPMALKSLDASHLQSIENCESTAFSIFVNVRGELLPCSFAEGTPGWETGIDLLSDLTDNVWYHTRVKAFREGLLKSSSECDCNVKQHCRSCPLFDITPCVAKPHLPSSSRLVSISK